MREIKINLSVVKGFLIFNDEKNSKPNVYCDVSGNFHSICLIKVHCRLSSEYVLHTFCFMDCLSWHVMTAQVS